MSKIKYALILLSIMISCQDNNNGSETKKQKIFFNNLKLEIPANWEYETNNLSFRTREKDTRNTLTINFMNLDVDTKSALLEAKKMSSGNDFFDNAEFTEIKRNTFNGFPSSEISFSGYKDGKLHKGTFMTFKYKNDVIFLTFLGKEDFIERNVLSSIISPIELK